MFDFTKLKTIKTWRIYINNCPVSGYFDFEQKEEAEKMVIQKGGKIVLEYITVLQD